MQELEEEIRDESRQRDRFSLAPTRIISAGEIVRSEPELLPCYSLTHADASFYHEKC